MTVTRVRFGRILLAIAFFSAAVFPACHTSPPEEYSDDGSAGEPDGMGFNPTDETLNGKKVVGLTVEPDGTTLTIVNGDVTVPSASLTYSATAALADGTTAPVSSCLWSLDRVNLGSFIGSTFKATGNEGGKGIVTCTAFGLKGTGALTVLLSDSTNTSGIDAASQTALLAATAPDAQVTKLLYPYDSTVFPRGLPSPELMWTGAAATDVYALKFEEPGMVYTSIFKATVPARATIPKEEWAKLLDTATSSAPLKVTLSRLPGGTGVAAVQSTSQSWTIATANLQGTIYYWRINTGSVVRIKPGALAPEEFIKPSKPHTCVACHSISHDGSTLVAAYAGDTSPWVTFDPKTGAENYSSGKISGFEAIYPDGSLVVYGQSTGALALAQSKGSSLEPSGLAAFGTATHPTFSPDGKKLAFGVRTNGNWLDFSNSHLAVAPFDVATKKIGAMQTLRMSGGRTMTYPSFTPDSQYIAYMDSTASRARGSSADLHLISSDGSGDVMLANAGGAGIAPADKSLNYEPTFNPIVSGGYYWVVFVSQRQYGNRLMSTVTAERHSQLWVAAIDASPKPSIDPSHAAFWLPGQDVNDQNMRGYWALDPCKKLGEGCAAGFECCDGACTSPDGKAAKVCSNPPPGSCKKLTDKKASYRYVVPV
ncbi:MAG: hypothetical protein NVS3B20_08600 [Polyangiales bacterium]